MDVMTFAGRQIVIADWEALKTALPASRRPKVVLLTAWPGFEISYEALHPLLKRLIAAGTDWFVCVGSQSEALHDRIDHCIVTEEMDLRIDADRTVVTTWHDDEPLDDAIEFFLFTAGMHDGHDRCRLAILNPNAPQDAELRAVIKARLEAHDVGPRSK